LRPAANASAALDDTSPPNRSSDSEYHKFRYFWIVGRSTPPLRAHVAVTLLHRLAGALDDALHASLADEHVVCFLGEHEPTRARQRIEAALGERGELVLAVAVREHREHEERQPGA
jgi:hypothetical protein